MKTIFITSIETVYLLTNVAGLNLQAKSAPISSATSLEEVAFQLKNLDFAQTEIDAATEQLKKGSSVML